MRIAAVMLHRLVLMASLLAGTMAQAELADPTAPLGRASDIKEGPVTNPAPQLQAVMDNGNGRIAIIDGARYRHNDLVAGYRLRTIRANGVVLDKAGVILELQLQSLTGRLK